jgi:hypothetical protein
MNKYNIDFFYMHLFTMRSQCFKSVIQSGRSLLVGVSPLQIVNSHRNRRYFVIKLHTWFCLSYFLKTNKIWLHLTIFYEYQQFFQHRICFSIQPQLQLVNLHRNRRYFVIKLHTWFCLSYFLKTNITLYCI